MIILSVVGVDNIFFQLFLEILAIEVVKLLSKVLDSINEFAECSLGEVVLDSIGTLIGKELDYGADIKVLLAIPFI